MIGNGGGYSDYNRIQVSYYDTFGTPYKAQSESQDKALDYRDLFDKDGQPTTLFELGRSAFELTAPLSALGWTLGHQGEFFAFDFGFTRKGDVAIEVCVNSGKGIMEEVVGDSSCQTFYRIVSPDIAVEVAHDLYDCALEDLGQFGIRRMGNGAHFPIAIEKAIKERK